MIPILIINYHWYHWFLYHLSTSHVELSPRRLQDPKRQSMRLGEPRRTVWKNCTVLETIFLVKLGKTHENP